MVWIKFPLKSGSVAISFWRTYAMLTIDWKCTLIQNNAIADFKQSSKYYMTLNDTRDQVRNEYKPNRMKLTL